MTSFSGDSFKQRWRQFSLAEQLANAGSEVERAISWQRKNDKEYSKKALSRSLELLDLTIGDPRWKNRLKELTRMREILCDVFAGDNVYNTPHEFLQKYFYYFAYAARNRKR